jgi:TonB-linked SusC/RagA family outer membrane protein
MKKFLLFLGLLVFCVSFLSAQTKIITGTVTSATPGEGVIPGVTVQVKNTTIGALTDAGGKYTITVPRDATTLVFSYLGMKKQEIEIAGRTILDVAMDYDILALQEVVVTTGYGIKRTPKSSSSLEQVIQGDKLNEVRQVNINTAIVGKAAGIQLLGGSAANLNGTSYLRLRGNSGFGTGVKVIYVVDGTIIPSAADINVDDIDNVNVLSGPAAAAILGSQGANGAVIITTKKAKMSGGKSMGIELNSSVLASSVYILPAYQNDYAGGNVYDMVKYTYKDTDPVEWKPLDGKYYHNYSDDSSWGPRMAGQEYIPWYAWYPGTEYTGKTAKLVPQPDNVRDFYDVGMTYNNNIAFDKTGEDYNIRVLIGNIAVKGTIPTTTQNKTTLTLKTSYNVTRKLTVAANVNFFTTYTTGYFNEDYGNNTTGSFNSWFHRDLDMNIIRELKDLRSPVNSLASWNHNDPPAYRADDPILFYGGNYWTNFYSFYDYIKRYRRADRLFGDASLNYKIIEGLDFKVTYRRLQNNGWEERKNYAEFDESWANVPSGFGYYNTSTYYSTRENFETLLSFNKKFGKVSVNANAGSDFFRAIGKTNQAQTVTGLNVRNLFAISNSKDQPSVTNNRTAEKYRAVFLRGNAGFGDFIFGEFTLRNDWFSALPPDNNSILSKSFGASFVFSELLKLHWLSFGKLRASWGEIPASIDAYVYPGFEYKVDQYQWNGNYVMTTPDQLVDPAITGGVKTQKEAGLELRFLDNRYGLNVTYWDGTEKDIPYAITVSGYSGFSSIYLNTGKIVKQGLDITLNINPLNKTNIKWDFNATVSLLIKNDVVSIAEGVDRFVAEYASGPNLVHAEGHPWGELYGWGMKMYNGKPELNADGSYVIDQEKYFGNVLPKVTGGLQNSFRILKNITLIANIDYQFGGKFFSLSELLGTFSGLTAWTSGLNDRGVPVRDPVADGGGVHVFGVDATTHEDVDYYVESYLYFRNFNSQGIYDPFVYDLTYIKFREFSIGYDLPVEKMGGLNKYIRGAALSLVAQNFWLIYAKCYDFDPSEVPEVTGEEAMYPGIRSFGINLKVIF